MSADHRGSHPARHFSIANPAGPGETSVPGLLRRLADALEEMGDVEILDITYEDCADGSPSMTVYLAAGDDA